MAEEEISVFEPPFKVGEKVLDRVPDMEAESILMCR